MKSAQKPTGRAGNGKWCHFTTIACPSEFERHLKPIKGDVFGGVGGDFTGLAGGTENA